MPYRNRESDSWRVRKNYGKLAGVVVPPFDVSLNTKKKPEAERIETALDALTELGVSGAVLLRDIATKKRRPIDVYHIYKSQGVKEVAAIVNEERLDTAWKHFIKTAQKKDGTSPGPKTLYSYERAVDQLLSVDRDALVSELPAVLEKYRAVCIKRKTFTAFKRVKAACQAFARNHEPDKQFSALWRDVSKIDGTPSSPGKTDIALRVFEIRKVIDALPDQQMKNVAWAMVLTGMGPGEYAGYWELKADRVIIKGTKNTNRVREVPLLGTITPEPFAYHQGGSGMMRNRFMGSPLHYKRFSHAVRAVSGNGPYLFRHSYRLWLREAGVDEWRADRYFGHVAKDLKRKYAGHEWDAFMKADQKKLIEYIKREWEEPEQENEPVELLNIT